MEHPQGFFQKWRVFDQNKQKVGTTNRGQWACVADPPLNAALARVNIMEQTPEHKKLVQRVKELEQERQKRKQVEKELLESKQRFDRLINTIPCALYDYVLYSDGRSRFLYISSQCKEIFEYEADRIVEAPDLLWNMVHSDDLERLKREDREANQTRTLFRSETRIILPSGKMKWIQLTSMPSAQKHDSRDIWSGVILDITERKMAEEERNRLILELQSALAKVKTLSGLLPICASCKKIRDDKGYWNQIESYIIDHSEADFSHCICPDCAKKLYPEFDLHKE